MKKYIDNQKYNLILKSARRLFSLKGYNGTTLEEISEDAKVGKGTVYLYFKNKEDLFIKVVEDGLFQLKKRMIDRVDKISFPLKRISKAIDEYLSYFEENSDFVKLMIHEQSHFGERIRKRYFEHYYGNIDRIKDTFKKGIKMGLIKNMDVHSMVTTLTSILNGLVYMWEIEGRSFKLSKQASLVKKIFFTGILKRKKEL